MNGSSLHNHDVLPLFGDRVAMKGSEFIVNLKAKKNEEKKINLDPKKKN